MSTINFYDILIHAKNTRNLIFFKNYQIMCYLVYNISVVSGVTIIYLIAYIKLEFCVEAL